MALITEFYGSGSRYGFDEDALHRNLLACGFATFRYRPFERRLESLHGARSGGGNTLYIREADRLADWDEGSAPVSIEDRGGFRVARSASKRTGSVCKGFF